MGAIILLIWLFKTMYVERSENSKYIMCMIVPYRNKRAELTRNHCKLDYVNYWKARVRHVMLLNNIVRPFEYLIAHEFV